MAKEWAKAFYNSSMWKTLRHQILLRDMFTCPYCGARATEVHHIVELTPTNICDPKVALNPENLQSLCHDCHSKITMQEHGIKNLDCDLNYYFDADGNLQKVPTPPEGARIFGGEKTDQHSSV